jgi:endogenous inhibitor of DNA gyrase (YacG/DUF329 family)
MGTLDRLFKLDDVEFYPHVVVSFLNSSEDEIREMYECSTKIKPKIASSDDLVQFHKELKWVMEAIWQKENLKKVEEFLSTKLNEMHHEVSIDDEGLFTQLRADETILEAWLNIMTDSNLLYGSNTERKKVSKCEWCGKWLARKRSTRRFCSNQCRNMYYNSEKRKSRKSEKDKNFFTL